MCIDLFGYFFHSSYRRRERRLRRWARPRRTEQLVAAHDRVTAHGAAHQQPLLTHVARGVHQPRRAHLCGSRAGDERRRERDPEPISQRGVDGVTEKMPNLEDPCAVDHGGAGEWESISTPALPAFPPVRCEAWTEITEGDLSQQLHFMRWPGICRPEPPSDTFVSIF
jgi:hypothetical protein